MLEFLVNGCCDSSFNLSLYLIQRFYCHLELSIYLVIERFVIEIDIKHYNELCHEIYTLLLSWIDAINMFIKSLRLLLKRLHSVHIRSMSSSFSLFTI